MTSTTTGNLDEKCKRGIKLLNDLEKLREEQFQCDFEVRIDGERFPVHRTVLAASSNYFKVMLNSDMKEPNQGYVEMKELEVKAVKACLDYIYSGEIDLNYEEIEPILKASDMLQIDDLKELSFGYLSKNITAENCFQISSYAMTYNSENTVKISEKFIGDHFAAVAETEQFKLLDKAKLLECFKFSKGSLAVETNNSTKDSVPGSGMSSSYKDAGVRRSLVLTQWRAIVNWVELDHAERLKHLLELLKSIGPIDTSTVFSDILAHPLIEWSHVCQEFLVKEFVLPNADSITDYITTENCFSLRSWANRFDSNDLKKTVYNFMVENFGKVVKSERLGELDMEDFRTILTDAGMKKYGEKQKYEAIIRWMRKREAEKVDHFEELFGLLDLTQLTLDFINETVRNEELVKSSTACNGKIMDALYTHANFARRKNDDRRENVHAKGQNSSARGYPDDYSDGCRGNAHDRDHNSSARGYYDYYNDGHRRNAHAEGRNSATGYHIPDSHYGYDSRRY